MSQYMRGLLKYIRAASNRLGLLAPKVNPSPPSKALNPDRALSKYRISRRIIAALDRDIRSRSWWTIVPARKRPLSDVWSLMCSREAYVVLWH